MNNKELRDALGERLLLIVKTEEELSPSMVSSVVNFLKAFPPPDELDDLPVSKRLAESLEKYKTPLPFQQRGDA